MTVWQIGALLPCAIGDGVAFAVDAGTFCRRLVALPAGALVGVALV